MANDTERIIFLVCAVGYLYIFSGEMCVQMFCPF